MGIMSRNRRALTMLKNIRDRFAEFDLRNNYTEEKWGELLPKLKKVVVEYQLPVNLWDGNWKHSANGVEYVSGERLSYAPITCNLKSDIAWFNFYKFGNFDIDDDIAALEEYLEDRQAKYVR